MDSVSVERRSEIMGRVHSRDTKPEMIVRRLVYSMGYRYRLSVKGLPGKPDLVFSGRRKVIFVHGCFWHRHESCSLARIPKSRQQFWAEKLEGNRNRDIQNQGELLAQGWQVLTLWECELKNAALLEEKIRGFLGAEP